GWLATGLSDYGHYYIVAMPFWALLNVAAIDRVARWANEKWSLAREWVLRVITGVVVVMVCWHDVPSLLRTRAEIAEEAETESVGDCLRMDKRLDEMTRPDEPILVAGSEPQILNYAHRFSPTRFVIVYPLMMLTPVAKNYQREAIREIEEHPPVAIVYVPAGS